MPNKEENTPEYLIADEVPERYKARVAALEEDLKYAESVAKVLPSNLFKELSDEQIAWIIDSEQKGGRYLYDLAIYIFSEIVDPGNVPLPLSHPVWKCVRSYLEIALHIRLLEEFQNRRNQKENAYGRAARAFLIEQNEVATKDLTDMAIGRRLRFHPEYAGIEGKQEISSMILEALMNRLAQYFDQPNKELSNLGLRLLASMRGELNYVPKNAHREVLDHLERLSKDKDMRVFDKPNLKDDNEDNDSEDFMESFPDLNKDQTTIQKKIYLDRILASPKLTSTQKLIVDRVLEGKTQTEIADECGISQQAIGKQLRSIAIKIPRDGS
jgi:hypothetical protein